MTDADFVFLSIRAGGVAARARDEACAIALGAVGLETVGPAGFAMAMRNIPPAVEYAQLVARAAPRAWIVNFTNPRRQPCPRATVGRRAAAVVVKPETGHLDRSLSLLQAVAANLLVMIGVGPFLTIPFMLTAMGGPHILYA